MQRSLRAEDLLSAPICLPEQVEGCSRGILPGRSQEGLGLISFGDFLQVFGADASQIPCRRSVDVLDNDFMLAGMRMLALRRIATSLCTRSLT